MDDDRLRVLIVDDSEDDTLLMADQLREAGYDLTYLRVDTAEAMRAALAEQTWSLIIADYTMPRFSGREALQVLQESGLDIPFILVSGTAGENIGVDMMHAGAQDFILKSSLSRLQPAVARELSDMAARRKARVAEDAARAASESYRTIFECSPAVILAFDREGTLTQVNPAFEHAFEMDSEAVVGRPIWEVLGHPESEEAARRLIARVLSGERIRNLEWEHRRTDGQTTYLLTDVTPVRDEKGEVSMGLAISTDITDRKLDEQRQQALVAHKREFYKRTILAATGGKLVIAEPEEIRALAGPAFREWSIGSLTDIEHARNDIRRVSRELQMDESQSQALVGCALEAMANVLKHAGGGTVTIHRKDEALLLTASDTGPGIEALSLPDVALRKGYSTAASLGMGYKVMIEFADKVYLATGPDGTVVAVEVKLKAGVSPGEAALEALFSW